MSFGRFERSTQARAFSDINVTPLVDVMLVLVVIFIITAPLLASSIRLDLPRSDAAKPPDTPLFVSVVVDARGQLYFNDRRMTAPELAQALAQAATRDTQTEVQLRADTTVPYGRVVEVMGLAHKAGLTRIGFVADPSAAATNASAAPETPATPSVPGVPAATPTR